MKIKSEFVLREIMGESIVFFVGDACASSHQMLSLNESGVLLWRALETGADEQELIQKLCTEYEITPDLAARDAAAFIQKLRDNGCL